MNPYLRTHHLTRLIDGIRVIAPGAAFERFGGRLLNHYLGIPLSHRGLNVLGHPVGGTIDTIDDTDQIAAEYSAEQGYFEGAMPKATKDAEHAVDRHPKAQHIFLLSSQSAPVGKIDEFKQSLASRHEFQGRTLHVFDARRLAEILVDDLLVSDTAVEQLAEYLPVLQAIQDEHAASLSVPATDYRQYVERPDVTAEIATRLKASRCAVTWGLPGSGKSGAAASFANLYKDEYDLTIWLEGTEIGKIEDLRAVRLRRGGETRNVSTLLSTLRCLVIIDDARTTLPPSDLANLCRDGSHIVVTQRHEAKGGFEFPLMSRQEAAVLLNRQIATTCPDEIWNLIWRTVGGHPLSLKLMNAAVASGASWNDISADCAVVGQLGDDRQRLADRLFERLRPALDRELSVFAWAGQPTCDRGFLNSVVQPVGLRKLRQQGLTAADRLGAVRLHDVVFASLGTFEKPGAQRLSELDAALEAYIDRVFDEPGLAFSSVAAQMKPKLEALVRTGDCRPAYVLALLKVWQPSEMNIEVLGDPMASAETLQKRMGPIARTEVSAVIETIEGLYRAEKHSHGIEEAKSRYRARLPVYDRLETLAGLAPRQISEIYHHKGKALNILGEREQAAKLFKQVLDGPSPLHESRLQLIRIHARKDDTAPDAIILAEEIFEAASRSEDVSNSVILAVVEALPWGEGAWREKLLAKYADLVEHSIVEAIEIDLDHGYQAFAAVSRHWVWHDQDRFRRVSQALPPRSPNDVASDRERFHYGEILQNAAKAIPDQANHYRAEALEYYGAMESPNDFQIQKHGQLLVEMGRPDRALSLLSTIATLETNPWALYWLSKATLDIGKPNEALSLINKALSLLNQRTQTYLSAFLAHRYEIRRQMNDSACVDDLIEAHRKCTDAKFKQVLAARLAELRA